MNHDALAALRSSARAAHTGALADIPTMDKVELVGIGALGAGVLAFALFSAKRSSCATWAEEKSKEYDQLHRAVEISGNSVEKQQAPFYAGLAQGYEAAAKHMKNG